MKEKTKAIFFISIIGYAIVYLVISFIIWEFRNPFFWIVNISSYSGMERTAILMVITICFMMVEAIAHFYLQVKKKDETKS